MQDQNEFLRQMEELVEFGRTKENLLTKEEVADYCSDMELTAEQLTLVYAYLDEHRIHVPGFSKGQMPQEKEKDKNAAEDSKYLRIYRKELKALPVYEKEEMQHLYDRLCHGEEAVIQKVVEGHLDRVVTLAGKYRGRGVPQEDLIQEGNLELMTCISALCGSGETKDPKKRIDHAVGSRLIALVEEELANDTQENSVLGRMNLLLEATRTLAEEYGRVATMEELTAFTHMDEPEIRMYVDLSGDHIEIGTGEKNGGSVTE